MEPADVVTFKYTIEPYPSMPHCSFVSVGLSQIARVSGPQLLHDPEHLLN